MTNSKMLLGNIINEKIIEYMIIRMRFHIVKSCRPLSRFMVSVALRCHYLETLLLTLASFQSMEALDSWA